MTNFVSHFKYGIFYRDKRFATIKIFKNFIYLVKKIHIISADSVFLSRTAVMIYPFFSLPRPSGRMKKKRKKESVADTTYIDIRDGVYHRSPKGIFYKGFGDFDTGRI